MSSEDRALEHGLETQTRTQRHKMDHYFDGLLHEVDVLGVHDGHQLLHIGHIVACVTKKLSIHHRHAMVACELHVCIGAPMCHGEIRTHGWTILFRFVEVGQMLAETRLNDKSHASIN